MRHTEGQEEMAALSLVNPDHIAFSSSASSERTHRRHLPGDLWTTGFLPGRPWLSGVPAQSPLPGREDSGHGPQLLSAFAKASRITGGITEPCKASALLERKWEVGVGLFHGGCGGRLQNRGEENFYLLLSKILQ